MSLTRFDPPYLKTASLGKPFFHVDRTASTQTLLKDLLKQGFGHGTSVLADQQSEGRGSKGRTWLSLTGPQILLSFAFDAESMPIKNIPILNIVVGIVMVRLLRRLGPVARLKWPNDVYVEDKKICGILSELISARGKNYVVVGLGLNHSCEASDLPQEISARATVLSDHIRPVPDRFQIVCDYYESLESYLKKLSSQHSTLIQDDFKELWLYKDTPIRVDDGSVHMEGVANEIDSNGALILETSSGKHKILSADISPLTVL